MSASAEHAYEEIYRRIRGGVIAPGEALIERQLCHELAVSRTPVREALRRLTAEGLAESRPNRSVVVAKLSDRELAEAFEVGVVLESFAAGLAARNAGNNPHESLRSLLIDMRATLAVDQLDLAGYVELDQRFHLALAQLTGNQRLVAMLRSATDLRILSQAFRHYTAAQLERSLRQHEVILEAIESGDEDWAASAMRTHILSGKASSAGD